MIELVIYVGILLTMAVAAVSSLIAIGRTYNTIQSAQRIDANAQIVLDRMGYEIRSASSVDIAQSTLGSSPGILQLNTTDDSGTAMTIQFFVSNQALRIKENGVDLGPLTASSVRVTSLIFRRITTTNSQAVKTELTLESGTGPSYRTKTFYTTTVLRGSYPI